MFVTVVCGRYDVRHAKKHHIVRGKCSQAVGQKCEYTLLESALKHTHHERTKAHVTVVTDTHTIIEMSTSVLLCSLQAQGVLIAPPTTGKTESDGRRRVGGS